MERIRQAMERALEQKWVPPVRPADVTLGARRRQEKPSASAKNPLRRSFPFLPVAPDVFARNRLVAAIKTSKHREA